MIFVFIYDIVGRRHFPVGKVPVVQAGAFGFRFPNHGKAGCCGMELQP